MSTNEQVTELVHKIRNGERDKIYELWYKVERLVAWRADKVIKKLPASAGVTFEDLYNSGYIALCEAVERYDEEKGEFIALFILRLKSAFIEASGSKSKHALKDPLRQANTQSLDQPLDRAEDMRLSDVLEDERNYFEDIEEQIYNEQLHEALERCLNSIPVHESEVIRRRYYKGETRKDISRVMGITEYQAIDFEKNAIRDIRKSKHFKCLQQFVEERTPYYLHVGIQQFNTTQTSSTEKVVLIREALEQEWALRGKEID